jgi:hypothetical protein
MLNRWREEGLIWLRVAPVSHVSTKPVHDPNHTVTPNGSLPPWPDFDPLEEAARIARGLGKIDKSQLSVSEPRRVRDPNHLKRVASRLCLICGRNRAQAHHLTYLQPRAMPERSPTSSPFRCAPHITGSYMHSATSTASGRTKVSIRSQPPKHFGRGVTSHKPTESLKGGLHYS